MALPKAVDEAVARRLFDDVERLGWAGMTGRQKSDQYARWVDDPEVGGRLAKFMSPADVRVWIKDGPIKEHPRALAGIGKYAPLVEGRGGSAADIVRRALGGSWTADKTTIAVKPLRLIAHHADERAMVTWGPSRDFKHLLWAALSAEASGDPHDWILVVTGSFTRPIPADEKANQKRIARRCGLRLVHVEIG